MGLQAIEAAARKLNSFWRAVVLSDDAPVTQQFPIHEEIQRHAYEIYLSRGASDGRDLKDWLQAERDLRQANASAASAQA